MAVFFVSDQEIIIFDVIYTTKNMSNNLFRPTDLTIIDSTVVIKTGGPMGPGEILENNKIIAGDDLVAVDSLDCELLGYPAEEVVSIVKAHELGLDEIDYTKLKIVEA